MALVQNPIIGNTSGKYSSAVFYDYFGKKVMRSKPLQVANPQTPNQQLYRNKFRLVHKFVSDNIHIFRNALSELTNNNSVYIASIGYFMQHCTKLINGNFTFNTDNFIFSLGTFLNIDELTKCEFAENFDIFLEWNDNSGTEGATGEDIVNFIIYNETTNRLQRFQSTREDLQFTITQTLTNIQENDVVHLYHYTSNPTATEHSNTTKKDISIYVDPQDYLLIEYDLPENTPDKTLALWNDFFGLSQAPSLFTAFEKSGNRIKLYGASELYLQENQFKENTHLIKFIDWTGQFYYITDSAFHSCSNLIEVYLPAVNTIEPNAFYACYLLSSIYLPFVEYVGNYAFYYCNSLTSINLPNVTMIGNYCFNHNISLTEIYIPIVNILGDNNNNNLIFGAITGNTISLTVNEYFATNYNGGPDREFTSLIANNNVTLIPYHIQGAPK